MNALVFITLGAAALVAWVLFFAALRPFDQ